MLLTGELRERVTRRGLAAAGGAKFGERFHLFHPVVDDGAIGGAIYQFPHAAFEGSGAFEQMREAFAIAGAGFVDGAFVALEELAALGVAAEDQDPVIVLSGVFVQEGFLRESEEVGQLLDVAFDNGDVGDAAAFGALAAIDGVGDFFGGFAELAFDEGSRLHILAEAAVFVALLFAEPLDLHQVGNHSLPGYNHSVPDRLYFSCSLRETGEAQMLQQFGKLLGVFPFSKLAKRGPVMRIYAIELVEPPVFEREFPVGTEVEVMIEAMR